MKTFGIFCGLCLLTSLGTYGQNPEIIFLPFEETRYVIRSSNSKTPVDKVSDTDGNINGHGYVDLGLPSGLKWASANIGASTPDQNGSYFCWGETSTKKDYSYSESATYDKNASVLKAMGVINTSGILTPSYDAAHVNWGGSWRMPTKKEYDELEKYCKWTWIELNDTKGWKVTGPNGKSIFFPAAGIYYKTSNDKDGDLGYYWTSDIPARFETNSGTFEFGCANRFLDSSEHRYGGRTIRAVSQ